MARVLVYGFDEMNYVAADIRAVWTEPDGGAEPDFDPDTGELKNCQMIGRYYRTWGQAKRAALSMLRQDVRDLQWTVKMVQKLARPTPPDPED